MKVIWKFPLDPINAYCVMPKGAHILSVAEQGGRVALWAECDPEAKLEPRRIAAMFTGNGVPEGVFIGTVLLDSGALVLHIYDGGEA